MSLTTADAVAEPIVMADDPTMTEEDFDGGYEIIDGRMVPKHPVTEEEPFEGRYEIIDGEFIEKPPMKLPHGILAAAFTIRVGSYVELQDLGQMASEALFEMKSEKRRARRPDVSYYSYDRLPRDRESDQPGRPVSDAVAPDLAIEVVSPTDKAIDLLVRIADYFVADVRGVWVIYHQPRCAYLYRSLIDVTVIGPGGTIDGGEILPGFRVGLDEFFKNVR